jgi:hypothetical protein
MTIVISPTERADNVSILLYRMAGLQSSLHQEILSIYNSSYDSSFFLETRALDFKAQIDQWIIDWEHDYSTAMAETSQISNQRRDTEYKSWICFGQMLHSKAMFLLRGTSDIMHIAADISWAYRAAVSLVETHNDLVSSNDFSSVCEGQGHIIAGFPICWTHYHDLFNAGLIILESDVDGPIEQLSKDALLERCHIVLMSLEACMGDVDSNLSQCLEKLIDASTRLSKALT